MDSGLWDQTIDIATSEGVLADAPDGDAYTDTYAKAALELLGDADTNGSGWSPVTIELTAGGE